MRCFEDEMFGDAYYDINYKKNVSNKKPNTLPRNEDVKLLMGECLKVMKNIDVMDFAHEYIDVRAATATYLIMFNTRRGGEPVRLLISQREEALVVNLLSLLIDIKHTGMLEEKLDMFILIDILQYVYKKCHLRARNMLKTI